MMLPNGNIDAATFLRRYWQRKPLLMRQACAGFEEPLSPEELAGLACEEEVESRLVFTHKDDWELKSGPFAEHDFTSLPKDNWTLLVQSADLWVEEVKLLLQAVPFIPNWRVDDVMISYATPGGGVGPHFDYYDVFLVQGRGSRTWRIGQHCTAADELRSASGLKLLSHFETQAEYTLHHGDVLYVPPGVAHWGVSNDDSLCYSIGFRAPSVAELLLGYSEQLADQFSADQRYTDPALDAAQPAGEVSQAAIDQAWRLLQRALRDKDGFAQWFAASMTESRYPDSIVPRQRLSNKLTGATHYRLHPASRCAWRQGPDALELYCDGHGGAWPDSAALRKLLQALSVPGALVPATLFQRNANCREVLQHLLLEGSLHPA